MVIGYINKYLEERKKRGTIKFKALITFSNSVNSIKKDLEKISENFQIFNQVDLDLQQNLLGEERKIFINRESSFENLNSNLNSLILSISGTLKFYEKENFGKELKTILNILIKIKTKNKIKNLSLLKNHDFGIFSSEVKFLDTKLKECLLILNHMQKNNPKYFEDKSSFAA